MLFHMFCPLFCPFICRPLDDGKDGKPVEREGSIDKFRGPSETANPTGSQPAAYTHCISLTASPVADPQSPDTSFCDHDACLSGQAPASLGGFGISASGKSDEQMRTGLKNYNVAPQFREHNLVAYTCSSLYCSPIKNFRYWLRCVGHFYNSACTTFTANVVRVIIIHSIGTLLSINRSINIFADFDS